MIGLGVLYAFDCYGCRYNPTNPAKLLKAVVETAQKAGLHVVGNVAELFAKEDWGDKHGGSVITLVVPLRESHIALHTWPAHRFASIDLYTCGDANKAYDAAVALAGAFGPERIEKQTVWRGLMLGECPNC